MTGMDMKRGEEKRERDKERGKEGSLNMKRMKRKKKSMPPIKILPFSLALSHSFILSFNLPSLAHLHTRAGCSALSDQ